MTPSTDRPASATDSPPRLMREGWRPSSRLVDVALVAIIIAWRLPSYLDVAIHGEVGFDEYLHLFIAGIHPLTRMWHEMMPDAHPPLHYLLTRLFMGLGSSFVWPRLSSLIPAVVTIALFYACLRSLGLRRSLCFATTLLMAAAENFSQAAILIRAYSLAMMFLMATLLLYIQLLVEPRSWTRGKTRLILAVALLAAWSVYASLFMLFCLCLTLLAYLLASREFRGRLLEMRGAIFVVPEWTAVVAGTVALGCVYHHCKGRTVGHLAPHFPQHGESLIDFARRGLAAEATAFTPFSFRPNVWSFVCFAAFGAASAVLVVRYLRSGSPQLQARALLVLAGCEILALLFALALCYVYPFGGEARHQFVLYPFLLFTFAFLLESLAHLLPGHLPRAVLFALVVAGAVITAERGFWTRRKKPTWSSEYQAFETGLVEPLCVAQYHFMCLYVGEHNARWEHVRGVIEGCDLYRVKGDHFTRSVYRGSRMIDIVGPASEKWFFMRLSKVLQQTRLPFLWVITSNFSEFGPILERVDVISPEVNQEFLRSVGLTVDQSLFLGKSVLLRVRYAGGSKP